MLSYGGAAVEPDERHGAETWALSAMWWMLFGFVAVVVLGISFAGGFFAMPGGVYLVLIPIAFVFLLATCLNRLRRRRAAALVAHLAAAARLNMPLEQHLMAAAQSEPGIGRSDLEALAVRLRNGEPVATALRRVAPYIEPRTLARVNAAEANLDLPRALDAEADRLTRPTFSPTSGLGFPPMLYLLLTGVLTVAVLTLLMIFVVPSFQEIIADFGIPVPPATRLVFDVMAVLFHPVLLMLWVPLLFGSLVWLTAAAVRDIALPRPRVRPVAALWNKLTWDLPILGTARRGRAWATGFEAIAEALRIHRPLPEASRVAAGATGGKAGQRLLNFARNLEQAQPPADAARAAGLPRAATELLGPATATHSTADVFALLARHERGKSERATGFWNHVAPIAVTLLLSAVIGFVAWALLFAPLTALIDAVQPYGEVTL
jgi:type IV pilus assembly protein PilC